MKNGQYKLVKLEKVKEASPQVDLIRVYFEHLEHELVYMFGRYNEVVQYLDQDVLVDFREEIVDGAFVPCVASLSVISQVTTLDKEEGIKLYIDEDFELGTSNLVFNDLHEGDSIEKAIMYCIDHKYESSAKATWAELTVLDKKRSVRKLRVFDPDRDSTKFKGCFIKAFVKYTKYGLVASDVYLHSEATVDANPLVAIAMRSIQKAISNDTLLIEVVNNEGFLDKLPNYNLEEGYEAGFMAVRLAVELALIAQTRNISKHLDQELLTRLAVCEKLFVVTNREKATASLHMQNIIKLTKYPLARNKPLFTAIDKDSHINLPEVAFYEGIKKSASVVVDLYSQHNYTTVEDLLKGRF